jgi:large-conductance mechanosensitive channel
MSGQDDDDYDSADDNDVDADARKKAADFENLIKRRTSKINHGVSTVQQVKSDLTTATHYVVGDTRKHKFNFCIGIFTVFLVVMFVSLLRAAIARYARRTHSDAVSRQKFLLRNTAGRRLCL